jgi:hypothetical protein
VRDGGQLEVRKNEGKCKPLSLSLFFTASNILLTPSPIVIVVLSLRDSDKNEHFLDKRKYIDTHLKQTDRIVKLLPHTTDLFRILDKCPGTFQRRHTLQICYFFNNSVQGATMTTINVSKGQNRRELAFSLSQSFQVSLQIFWRLLVIGKRLDDRCTILLNIPA